MMNCEASKNKKKKIFIVLDFIRMSREGNNGVYRSVHLHKYKRWFQQEKLIQLANLMLTRTILLGLCYSTLFVSDFVGWDTIRIMIHNFVSFGKSNLGEIDTLSFFFRSVRSSIWWN
jgi:hypothetical protein